MIYCVKGLWKVNKHTQCIQVTIKSFKYLMASWMVNVKNQTVWTKNFAYSKVFGKAIKHNTFKYFWKQYFGKTDIVVKYPYSERSPPLKAGVTLTMFKSPGIISFSNDKTNINFKETYSSLKHFLTTSKLILLQTYILVDVLCLSQYSWEITWLCQK